MRKFWEDKTFEKYMWESVPREAIRINGTIVVLRSTKNSVIKIDIEFSQWFLVEKNISITLQSMPSTYRNTQYKNDSEEKKLISTIT